MKSKKVKKDSKTAETLLVRDWQDILAIYVYEKSKIGVDSYSLDKNAKSDLAAIFAELNPLMEGDDGLEYANRHINYYIRKYNITKDDRDILKKYTETDCKLLCATVTAAKGFVRQSVGDNVSEDRVDVISAAYSLVGKVGYFWGGKSTVIGEDPSWGSVATVTSEGSSTTGSLRAYGLDCSGFVTWAVINGYHDKAMQSAVGDGTSNQWANAKVVAEADAQPGDFVFQNGPEAGSNNHVGILVGKTDAGDWIAVHCSSSQNGVTVGEAYSASFRYIREPSFYVAKEAAEPEVTEDIDSIIVAGDEGFDDSMLSVIDTEFLDVAPYNDGSEAGTFSDPMDDNVYPGIVSFDETGFTAGSGEFTADVTIDDILSGDTLSDDLGAGVVLVEEEIPETAAAEEKISEALYGPDLVIVEDSAADQGPTVYTADIMLVDLFTSSDPAQTMQDHSEDEAETDGEPESETASEKEEPEKAEDEAEKTVSEEELKPSEDGNDSVVIVDFVSSDDEAVPVQTDDEGELFDSFDDGSASENGAADDELSSKPESDSRGKKTKTRSAASGHAFTDVLPTPTPAAILELTLSSLFTSN